MKHNSFDKTLISIFSKYFNSYDIESQKDAKKAIEEFNKDNEKRNKEIEKFKFELQHPEFTPLTPKEYGLKLLKCKPF